MIINHKILNIPPYISTTWNHVQALYLKDSQLIIGLANDTLIAIPNLKPEILDLIFSAHSTFLENQTSLQQEHPSSFQMSHAKVSPYTTTINAASETENDPSLTFGLGTFDSLGSALHHNDKQSNIPDLPKEILSKISAIAKIVAPEDTQALPKPEPHCNCVHCQIARAVQQGIDHLPETNLVTQVVEEEVNDADLVFQQWNIQQTGEKLFCVSNRLDLNEKYNVFLGNPVGCTCGNQGCEHILAVLKS